MMSEIKPCLYSKKDGSKFNNILNVLIFIIIVIIILELTFASTYSGIYVVENSMYPTLNGAPDEKSAGGDYVYVNTKIKPDYGDIVVVNKTSSKVIIKRVVAFGGDSVKLIDGVLYIKYSGTEDFVAINESYVAQENNTSAEKNNYPLLADSTVNPDGHIVRENAMFLLGDNRDVSVDSRDSGDFDVGSLIGVVTDFSMRNKKFLTAVHTFFAYEIPSWFTVD